MVRPVEEDARGIVDPTTGLARFRLDRYEPSPDVGRFVDRYWVATWDLAHDEPYTQRVFAHPVVNVVFGYGPATVGGVTTRVTERRLSGAGQVLGVMFRPAGFRPFLGRPMSTITDRQLPLDDVFGAAGADLEAAVLAAGDGPGMVSVTDRFLARLVPADRQPSEETTRVAERAAAEPSLVRVDALAQEAGISVRGLQRRFADHVGLSPKRVLRRYRLYKAAERARKGREVDWAALAWELGYSDQSHLVRDFSGAFGIPPDRYARRI